MSALHHPADDTLAAFASGALAPGLRLVVETHVHGCAECRSRLRACEAIGGALLDASEPAEALPNDLLSRTLARIEAVPLRAVPPHVSWVAPFPGAPQTLRDCRIGRWWFIYPGFRIATVTPAGESDISAVLMRVGAGGRMPTHTHTGFEYTQVLSGAYTDEYGRYAAGDFDEADGEVIHQPKAELLEDCVCLTAVEGRLQLTSFVGRVAQSLLGF